MDYAEKALTELIERYKNMTKEEYEEIYTSAMSKMKKKYILYNSIEVGKIEKLKSYKKSISYSASNISSSLVSGYEKSDSERCRPWAA